MSRVNGSGTPIASAVSGEMRTDWRLLAEESWLNAANLPSAEKRRCLYKIFPVFAMASGAPAASPAGERGTRIRCHDSSRLFKK